MSAVQEPVAPSIETIDNPFARWSRSKLTDYLFTTFPPLDATGIEEEVFYAIQGALIELRRRAVELKSPAYLRDAHTLQQEWVNVVDTIRGNAERVGVRAPIWTPGMPR